MEPARALPGLLLLISLAASGCGTFKRFLYEGFGRDGWQQPDEVVRVLEVGPGTAVADLGAGGAYFTGRLADAVGPAGTVYAIDVDPGMTGYLEETFIEEGRANVIVILAGYDDPGLPEAAVDLIFTCNTYHHIENRVEYFERAKRSLRAAGRIAIIDYKRYGWFQKLLGHYTPPAEIREEMEKAGYVLLAEHSFLARQSFFVFGLAPG